MINIASKAGNYLRATNQVVANGLRPLAGAALTEKKITSENREVSTVWSLQQSLPAQNVSVKSGVASKLCYKSDPLRQRCLFTYFCAIENYITNGIP
jgi:hypothetical protein